MTATPTPRGTRDDGLAVFRDPASVAVVGASADPAKWGHWLARGALDGTHRRAVHLVTHSGGEILGHPCATSLRVLPDVPELVAFCVPATEVPAVVDEALALGVRGLLGITAGVPDAPALAARVTAAGARLIGPGSLGLFDSSSSLRIAWGDFAPGPLAVISQSGQVGSELALLARRAGLGISRFVSVGAQLDVTTADLLQDLADHEATRAVALYVEGFEDGGRIFEAVRVLRAAGKPVLLLSVGTSEAGARAARSHTSALTSPAELVDAVCRAAGALRLATPAELVDVAACLLSGPRPRGTRIAIVSDSGGQGAIAADRATARGLDVPELSHPTTVGLGALLPGGAATANPVDLAGGGERNLDTYHHVVERLLRSEEIDGVLLSGYFGRYGVDTPKLAEAERRVADALARAARDHDRPLVVHTMGPDGATAHALREAGVPVFPTVDAAVDALAGAAALRAAPPPPVPLTVPAPAGTAAPGYWPARTLLAGHGLAFPRGREVHDADGTAAAARELHAPYVLKAGWLEHKSEAGGVHVGLPDPAAAADAFTAMRARLGPGPYVLEEQDTRPHVVELLIGARRDPRLGPLVTVGAGGTRTELHRDTVTERAPVDLDRAHTMLRALRCAPLLDGWRGAPAVDTGAAAQAVVAVSQLIAALPTAGTEVEINPLHVGPVGALAVDALVLTHPDGPAPATQGES
ncbi:acetate--CoA ligase family protein [Streptomyces sp. NPDC054861]